MKRVVVTGGAGYIGSHTVVELINAGYEPVIIDNFSNSERKILSQLNSITGRQIDCMELDVTNTDELSQSLSKLVGIAGVIHFAAFKAVGESVEHPFKYYQNNVGGLLSVLEAMKDNGISNFVFSSSCTVYGEPEGNEVSERTPLQPARSPYGHTKSIGESILMNLGSSDNKDGTAISSAILRYFNPIGAHESGLIGELPLGVPLNLVPYITQTAAGKRDKLTVYGDDYSTPDGSCVRDYIHIVDLAQAHVAALDWLCSQEKTPVVDVFNLGTGQGNSVLEVINTFEEVSGENLNYEIGPRRAGDVSSIWANTDKATEILGWKTKRSMRDALTDAWRWEQYLRNNW